MQTEPANQLEDQDLPELSVVIPVLDESARLAELVEEVRNILRSESGSFEIVICDDGSNDDSWTVIDSLSAQFDEVEGISLSRNFGKEAAMLAGLSVSRGRAAVVMDGDGQHPPQLLPEMISAWRAGAEIVEGVKTRRPDQSGIVRWAAQGFNRVFTLLTHVDLVDATDYRLLSRRVVDTVLRMPERVMFFRGLSQWVGFSRARLEFEPRRRVEGQSRFSLLALFRYAVRNLLSFTSAPLHIVTVIGFSFGVFALLLGLQTLWNWLRGVAVEGFTTVILLLLIQGSAIMIALGMIGVYLSQIHREVKGRPRYIIAATTGGIERSRLPYG